MGRKSQIFCLVKGLGIAKGDAWSSLYFSGIIVQSMENFWLWIIYDGYNDNVSYTALLLPLFSDFWGGNWRCFDNIQVSELRAWLLGMIQYPVTLNCLFS